VRDPRTGAKGESLRRMEPPGVGSPEGRHEEEGHPRLRAGGLGRGRRDTKLRDFLPVTLPAFALLCMFTVNANFTPAIPFGWDIHVAMYDVIWYIAGIYFFGSGGYPPASPDTTLGYLYYDTLGVALFCVLFWGVARISSKLTALQVLSFWAMLLPLEIWFGAGRIWFDAHVAQLQVSYNILPWFDNSDLLVVASAIFVSSTCVNFYRWVGHRGAAAGVKRRARV